MKISEIIFEARAETPFTTNQVVADILGADNVAFGMKGIRPNQFLVRDVDMEDAKWFSSKDKQASPNVFRGGEVRPHALSAFSRRDAYDNSPRPGMEKETWYTPPTPYMGDVKIPLNSRDAADVATAAHEAYHAWIWSKSKANGKLFANEKIVNQQAEKWLKSHLTGIALHIALETILHSKISYGHA